MKKFYTKLVYVSSIWGLLLFACKSNTLIQTPGVNDNPQQLVLNQPVSTPGQQTGINKPELNNPTNTTTVTNTGTNAKTATGSLTEPKIEVPLIKQTPIPNNIPSRKIPLPAHTVIIVLENHAFEQIIDDSAAPYINELAKSGALFTESYGLTHPSQPNYLMLFSGTNQGITDDNYPGKLPFSTPNLGAALLASGQSFIGYSEDLPSVGFKGATSGEYASKHSPWVYWQGTGKNMLPSDVNRPFTDFPKDFNTLPKVSFVIPNLENDMHNGIFNGIIKTGDKWLKDNINSYVQWAKNNNSLLILTFDEDNYFHGNNISTIFVGEMVKVGQYNEKISHYNILRTLEEMYGLPFLGESAKTTSIVNCWKQN